MAEAATYELSLGPGFVPDIAEALMEVAKLHGARLVSCGAAEYTLRVTFDKELPQSEIVEHLKPRLHGKFLRLDLADTG